MSPVDQSRDFPPLDTERLTLRNLTLDDIDFAFRHFGDPDVHRYLLDDDPVTSRDQAEEIVKFYLQPGGKSYNRWAIERKAGGVLMGTCGYHNWNKRDSRAEIGYDLSPEYWGQGYMTEALREVLRHGFEGMGLNRIQAVVHPDNSRSISLFEKFGFGKDGLLRQYHYSTGEHHDHLLYALLRQDLTAQ